ncbi:MAG: hypothetical protein CVU39_07690 [Chloroflexi bacterium HGW-Chloroflexi-10]|nr:MAG: hypothetical protein CVU39_07690 [Chloroflexi bacterium HGW-Chloroflexi-10]
MNQHEDKYLREKINRIIERQKEGKIIIASHKDGSGLPTREDLEQGLIRAAHPYDYAVGKAGFLKYDSEIGMYEFIVNPGEKQPSVLANYKQLSLAEAALDEPRRRIEIQNGDTNVVFTHVQHWKNLYELLREVNTELARLNSGIVVWKINQVNNEQAEVEEHLYHEAVPQLRNGQALAYISGYAYDEDRIPAYIGLVGYKTSLESLRVTLFSGKTLQMVQEGVGDVWLTPRDRYEQVWQPMPEYTSHQVGSISRMAVPGKWEPEDQYAYLLVFHGSVDPAQELIRLFIERLKEALEMPIMDEWALVLWKLAQHQKLVQSLTTGGDCLLGARINLQANWQELLENLLINQEISLAN